MTVSEACGRKQRLCTPPETSAVSEPQQNTPTVSDLDATYVPSVATLDPHPLPPPASIGEVILL